jgi:hypothetical protein
VGRGIPVKVLKAGEEIDLVAEAVKMSWIQVAGIKLPVCRGRPASVTTDICNSIWHEAKIGLSPGSKG